MTPERLRSLSAPLGLLLLPLALLALDPQWMFAGSRRDPWIYYGFFRDPSMLLSGSGTSYFASRTSVIFPGWALHRLLPPLAAHTLLHLLLFWVAVLCFYGVARHLSGRRAALLASVALGCHPFFLVSIGRDYVDGFGLAFLMLALMFLTLAAEKRGRWGHLAGAGAAVMALVSANVFYLAFVPFLAGFFWVLESRAERRSLLRISVELAMGGALVFFALCAASSALGGQFFYLKSSLSFVQQSAGHENPFRAPLRQWLPTAGFLVVPAVLALGAVLAVGRALRRAEGSLRARLEPALASLLLLAWVSFLLAYQIRMGPVLQYFYYASLLIPFAYLVLAHLLEPLVASLSDGTFRFVAAASAVLLAWPSAWSLPESVSASARQPGGPIAVALLLGIAAVLILWWAPRRAASVVLALTLLSASQFLASELSRIDREFDRLTPDRKGAFLQAEQAADFIRRQVPDGKFLLWFDAQEPLGVVYDPLASEFLLCARLLNMGLPRIDEPRSCDGRPLQVGMSLVLLSQRAEAVADARASLRKSGLGFEVTADERIVGPLPPFTVTLGHLTQAPAAAAP